MKVVAINGSPNLDKGNTALILTPFLEGMRDEGAEVKHFYISTRVWRHIFPIPVKMQFHGIRQDNVVAKF